MLRLKSFAGLFKQYAAQITSLRKKLLAYQIATEDPRETGNGDYLDSFPRLNGEIRNFPAP